MFVFLDEFRLSKDGQWYWAEVKPSTDTIEVRDGRKGYAVTAEKRSEIHHVDSEWGKLIAEVLNPPKKGRSK
jgi:hypothetical protein